MKNKMYPPASHHRLVSKMIGLFLFCMTLSFNLSAQSCTPTSPGVAFGNILVQPTPQIDITSNISLTCTGTVGQALRVCVSLTEGNGTGSTILNRNMSIPGTTIAYNLYKDAPRTQIWGRVNGAATPLQVDIVLPSSPYTFSLPLYARLAAGQTGKPVGAYQSRLQGNRNAARVTTNLGTSCASLTSNVTRRTFSFNVTAGTVSACQITANELSFGIHGGILSAPINAASSIQLTCTSALPYSIALNGGTVTGNTAARGMGVNSLPPKIIDYQIYKDAARTVAWTSVGAGLITGVGTGSAVTIPFYGRVPAQSAIPANDYSDTLDVTVTF